MRVYSTNQTAEITNKTTDGTTQQLIKALLEKNFLKVKYL